MTDLNFDVLANTARAAAALERLAAQMEGISDRLDRINGRRAEADVDVETTAAASAADRILERLRRINGQRATATVDIDRSVMDRLSSINGALNAMQKFALPVGIVALAPSLLSAAQAAVDLSGLLGVAAGGMAALAAVAGTVKVGFSGIPEVFKAMGAADKAATATAAQSGAQRVQIAERIRSAQEGVATAMESSSRRVAGAEAGLGQAQRQAQYAQEALNQARKDAKEDLEDLKLSLSGAALSEEAAQIALERAQQHLREAHAKGAQGLDLREAELGVKQASQALAEAHERYGDVKQASQEANRAGVEGSKQVVAAQRGVADANRATAAAQVDLKQAQVDGARQVADAQRALATAMQQTSTAGSSASTALADAMAKLSPNARDAVLAVKGLKPAWESLRVDVQDRMFAGLGATIKRVAGVELPVLRTGMGGVATQVNGVAKSFGEFFAKASTARDVGAIFDNTTHSVGFLGAALTDVVAVFMDVATVGSGFLPSLSQGLAGATGKLRDFVARARESGALAEWMQLAITRTEQLGHIVGNVGGVLVSIFRAAGTSGGDFLGTVEKITGELNRLLKTPTAQAGLSAFFRTITQTVDALLPGVKEFAVQFFAAVKAAADTGGLQKAGKAISDLLIAAGPLLPVLTKLAGETLGSLATSASNLAEPFHKIVDSVIGMVDAVGPLGPAVVGAVLAFKGLAGAGVVISALGVKMGALALRIGISEVAATRLAMAMRGVGVALPIVGALIVGAMVLYDQLKDKADDLAKSVQDGSMTLISAIEAETVVLERQDNTWKEFAKGAQDESAAIGAGIGELTGQTLAHADAVNRQKDAAHNVLAAWDAQIAAMPPLEAAQARVKRETEAHALAVKEFGDNSPQAIDAAGRLQKANEDLKTSQANAAEATKTHSERVLDLWRAELDIVDKDLAYRDAIDRVADAQDRAAQAVKEHGVNSREAQKAFRDVERANLDAAAAAGDKARADAEAAGASNAAELGAKAHKDELLRLAEKASGPVRQALLDAAGGIDVQKAASNTAELQTKLHKDELGKLADQATGPLKTALENAGKNFDTLGGKHADAKWKAQAQKDELLRLAQMADGPLRQSLTDMANQITNLPNKTVWITANGQMGIMTGFGAIGGPELVRMSHGGALGGVIKMGSWGLSGVGYDAGGILPGHTPGRDVHTFVSPTGGVLHLSGGEAVMRPEWTRAVGVDYVKKANEAAARGGPAGVGDLHLPGISRNDTGSFAQGGVILGGYQPFKDLPVAADIASSLQMAAKMDPLVVGRIKALVDYLTAAQGGGPGWEAALAWARTQQGKPYQWGGVGNPSWDCSGFISGIVNVMRGQSPNRRVGTTASMPWPGFLPGLGPGLNVGSSPSDHMAGTIGNVNVESASGRGVQVGGPAWGATNPYFKQHWHMLGPAGAGAVGNVAGGEVRAIVQRLAAQRGWGSDGQWDALAEIIRLESNWDPKAANKTSTARGLFQKMTSLHGPIEPTVEGQTAWGLNYIAHAHGGGPINNLAFHRIHGWYGNGGIVTRPTFGLLGEDGPEMVLPLTRPRRSGELMAQAGMGGDPGLTVNVTTSPYASAERIIQAAMHQSRLNRMAGRYGGR